MGVAGVKVVAAARNGVSAFILPCRRLDLHYCDWAGSSRGLNTFLQSPLLEKLTKQYPQTEFRVSPRPHRHPVLKAYYINGREKAICVRNLSREQVLQKAEILMNSSGLKNKKQRGKPVISGNQAVRGVWSPYHGGIKSPRFVSSCFVCSGFYQTSKSVDLNWKLKEPLTQSNKHQNGLKETTVRAGKRQQQQKGHHKGVLLNNYQGAERWRARAREHESTMSKQAATFGTRTNLTAPGRQHKKKQK